MPKPEAAPSPKAEKPAKVGRKPRAAKPMSGPRFGVFDDGTIELRLASCTGLVGTEDARALVQFLRQIGIEA